MFRTSEKDMQWLDSELKIGMSTQHAVTYMNKQTRRLD